MKTKSSRAFPHWRGYTNRIMGREISRVARYFSKVIQLLPLSFDSGLLLQEIDNPRKETSSSIAPPSQDEARLILLNGNLNHDYDIELLLKDLRASLSRRDRVLTVLYNPYFSPLLKLLHRLGIRKEEVPETFLTEVDLENIATLSGFELVSLRSMLYCPYHLWGIGNFLNRLLPGIPLLQRFGAGAFAILRPKMPSESPVTVSVIVPARNERGNIISALKRMPLFGGNLREVIFVEGHSNDGTWEEILRVCATHDHPFKIMAFQQAGKGKSDAVRLGFSKASADLLMILDADLTMPPELLPRFYDAYVGGLGDFINGSRLLYPMEGAAMRALNRIGNIFFAKALSLVLRTKLSDTLCGTKVINRSDYIRCVSWRKDFGEFDPFGDFDLLFPAACLGLGIIDVPIRYRDRVYGATNIRRFWHGAMLLKMTIIGYLRITLGARDTPSCRN